MNYGNVLCGGKTYGDDGVLYDVFFSGSATTSDSYVYNGYDSGTYYDDYIPNHFEDGELKPMRKRRRNENWKTKDRD